MVRFIVMVNGRNSECSAIAYDPLFYFRHYGRHKTVRVGQETKQSHLRYSIRVDSVKCNILFTNSFYCATFYIENKLIKFNTSSASRNNIE